MKKFFPLLFCTLLCFLAGFGCIDDAWLHQTSSLGGDTAGDRGTVDVLFINNTPHRAIFTWGGYDELDRTTLPILEQFGSDPDFEAVLDGETETAVLTEECRRTYAIGTAGLILRTEANLATDDYNTDLLVEGVRFSSADADSEDANTATEGVAAPHEALIGVDYECGALLIYRLEVNDAGPEPFVVELTVVPSESNRG